MGHKHHIVFRSHGGLDTNLNLHNYRGYEDHEGKNSPHQNREEDLRLKRNLQEEYYRIFSKEDYSIEEIAEELGKSEKYIFRHFKRVKNWAGRYKRDDIIKHLMGGKFY